VTIDEYDTCITNAAVSNTDFYKSASSEEIQSTFKSFFRLLKSANKRGVHAFITGVSPISLNDFTSGWNHAIKISDRAAFAGMYGFTEKDNVRALDMFQPALPDQLKTMLLEHCEQFNGYLFHPDQKDRIFNPGRVMFFFDNVFEAWQNIDKTLPVNDIFASLIDIPNDSQTAPAQSTLKFVIKYPVGKTILIELLKNKVIESKVPSGVDSSSFENVNQRSEMISFM
jgi:hypothetical protein